MDINEILNLSDPEKIIGTLKSKSVQTPNWGGAKGLVNEYDPNRHPVMNRSLYPDIVGDHGTLTHVTRVTYDLQRLAVKRTTELVTGVPVRRIYKPENVKQQQVAKVMERIFEKNRINSVNIERFSELFASCEIMTLWYAVQSPNNVYGVQSELKLRCRTFSPMKGDDLFPLFDEYGDLIALSVGYSRKIGNKSINYFDAYTKDRHIKWQNNEGWSVLEDEPITLGKIPGIYTYRPTPVWEDTSKLVYEMEWAMSRNGNYLRENSKPLFVVFADDNITYNQEGETDKEFKSVLQFPQGSTAQYVTWQQAVDNLKFYISELRQSFFTQLQLPDWSYESMKATPMSGESRKQLFIDAQLKVKDESGRLLEFLDREINVVKQFAKIILGDAFAADVDALQVENEITPYTITDDADTISMLQMANGNKPVMSQRESIEMLGWSADVEKTMAEIGEEADSDEINFANL